MLRATVSNALARSVEQPYQRFPFDYRIPKLASSQAANDRGGDVAVVPDYEVHWTDHGEFTPNAADGSQLKQDSIPGRRGVDGQAGLSEEIRHIVFRADSQYRPWY